MNRVAVLPLETKNHQAIRTAKGVFYSQTESKESKQFENEEAETVIITEKNEENIYTTDNFHIARPGYCQATRQNASGLAAGASSAAIIGWDQDFFCGGLLFESKNYHTAPAWSDFSETEFFFNNKFRSLKEILSFNGTTTKEDYFSNGLNEKHPFHAIFRVFTYFVTNIIYSFDPKIIVLQGYAFSVQEHVEYWIKSIHGLIHGDSIDLNIQYDSSDLKKTVLDGALMINFD